MKIYLQGTVQGHVISKLKRMLLQTGAENIYVKIPNKYGVMQGKKILKKLNTLYLIDLLHT